MAMTLRYAHLAPEHKANAVEKLVNKAKQRICKLFKRRPYKRKTPDSSPTL